MCGKGFSSTALDRCNRIKGFVFPRNREIAKEAALVGQLRDLYRARDSFVKVSIALEEKLDETEGKLRKRFPEWASYEAIMEGHDELKDAVDAHWFLGNG